MKLLQTVTELIREYDLLKKGDGVIVGCSGGPDSMCLLHLLMELKEPMDLTLRVVHLEHGFRGDASLEDAAYVETYCQEHDIDCVVHREQVRERAKKQGISEETAGREARYELFFAQRQQLLDELRQRTNGCEETASPQVKIAVAHNKNDQAETILMRILRGTGLDGLCGMELKRDDGLIRPLLTTDRSEIEAYCEENKLFPRQDHTNQETDYTRNRIRLELIPYMKEHFNDNVEDALCRLGSIAAESQAVIRSCAEEAAQGLRRDEQGRIDDRKGLARLDAGLRHELIRREWKKLGLCTNMSAVHLKQIDDLLQSEAASGSVDLPQGYRFAVAYDRSLWQSPAAKSAVVGRIKIHQRERWAGDTIAVLRRFPEKIRCFDADKILKALGRTEGTIEEQDLVLRFRQPGDVIRPLGSRGKKKLQDWFVDRKIPRQLRDETALVCIGNEVLWIIGHQISEKFKVDEQTKRLIFVEFHQ